MIFTPALWHGGFGNGWRTVGLCRRFGNGVHVFILVKYLLYLFAVGVHTGHLQVVC